VPLLEAAARGDLADLPLKHSPLAAATVIAVSGGYPEAYEKGKTVKGLDNAACESRSFHAGTKKEGDSIVASGGRGIAVTTLAATLPAALEQSYRSLSGITFDGMAYRRDIGRDVTSAK
ncbi:MAG: phosphoribosylamine--glycine ligase, partial [Muribaculaceae bacterium]|nr:phosphoribosylamine--glycine ligase [Muribaculaceae bacterium]